jgi:hypothetical protein
MANSRKRGSSRRASAKRKAKKSSSARTVHPKPQQARAAWFKSLFKEASLEEHPKLRKTAIGVLYGVLGTFFAAILAFLSEVHLEISFDKLRQFKATDLSSYSELFTAVTLAAELTTQQEFIAFWVDDDEGKHVIRSSDVIYKNFRLNNRLLMRSAGSTTAPGWCSRIAVRSAEQAFISSILCELRMSRRRPTSATALWTTTSVSARQTSGCCVVRSQ